MIAIIDYDAGNIKSVEKALQYLNEEVVITKEKSVILQADKVILPGVGSFGDAMHNLNKFDLVETIYKVVEKKIPFLGICLGLQLLFDESEESPGVKGLGILSGKILKFPENTEYKIPQIGWNSISIKSNAKLFQGIQDEAYVYFVHSYYLKANEEDIVVATSEYAAHVHASVEKGNIFACQFHPEKSSDVGLQILRNFAQL